MKTEQSELLTLIGLPAILDSIVPNSPAYNAGLLKGDRIVKVNGNDVVKLEEFTEQVKANTSQNIDIDIKKRK